MGKPFSRQPQATRICYYPAQPGSRAVFLAEARTRKEMRQIRELFDMVGRLAQVVPISDGTVMSYAVQVHGDTSLFGKIEWLLKTQFAFSIVERNLSDVTLHLVRSLCEDSDTRVEELPQCGLCESIDPFPTRATIEFGEAGDPQHLAYCSRCVTRHAEEDADQLIRTLVRKDVGRARVPASVPVVVMPDMVHARTHQDPEDLEGIAIAV